MKHIFREYDIRGIFEKELNEIVVKRIGYHLGEKIKKKGNYVAVGYDCRIHSKQLFNWLISGLNKAGLTVLSLGLSATPISYFSGFQTYNKTPISASIMITGSHLPGEYNGFKITIDNKPFFSDNIYQLGKEVLNSQIEIEDNFIVKEVNINKKYIEYLTNQFIYLKEFPKKIIFDSGNGVAGPILRSLIENLGLNAEILFEEPDGNFPNHHPDPSESKNLKDLKKALKKYDNAIGFAFDGDADRLGVIDKEIIRPDILATQYIKDIKNPKVVGEVKCSYVMYDEINKVGKAIMYKTGNCNIKQKVIEEKADLGIEYSGHIFFNDSYFGYDDGFYAMLRVLKLLYNGEELYQNIQKLPKTYTSEEIKIPVEEEKKFYVLNQIVNIIKEISLNNSNIKEIFQIDGIRVTFSNGWGLVRASNTSPYLTLRFEASSEELKEEYQKIIFNCIAKVLKL
jgi:phosphomannomutase/phosphoglucomutase